jgi:probable phosphoglycerate mutase
MLLLLARHGNTFESGEQAVWAGARTDLPLTAKGRQQAQALAKALDPMKTRLRWIAAGPLKRTRSYAEIVTAELGLAAEVKIDERLREIDYGAWEGKPSGEIEALRGGAELKAWNETGRWPQSPGWSPPAETIAANIAAIAAGLGSSVGTGEAALLVTSNGILKFFLKLVPGAFEEMAANGKLKVSTGHCCALRFDGTCWKVLFWDSPPVSLNI